jgi:hypothetical protein
MMREMYEDFLVLQEQDRKPDRHTYNYETVSVHQHNVSAMFSDFDVVSNKLADVALDDLQDLISGLAAELRLGSKLRAAKKAIEETIRLSTDQVFTPKIVDALSWRLAGNTHRLGQGMAVLPWRSSAQPDEWCAILVEGMQYPTFHAGTGRRGFSARYYALSGAPAGRTIERWHESGREFYIAKQLGFGNKDAEMLYHCELVGCQAHALLQPNNDESRPPYLRKFYVTEHQRRYNRELQEKRRRQPCPAALKPRGFQNCRACPAGYDSSLRGNELYCPLAVQRMPRKEEDAHAASPDNGGLPVVRAGQGPDLLHTGGDPIGAHTA